MPAPDRPLTRRLALATIGAATVGVPLVTTSSVDETAFDDYTAAVTSIMDEYDVRGVSVAIVPTNGASSVSPMYQRAFGLDRMSRDGDGQRRGALTPSHRLRIASVTKTLTATAILQLIDRGTLSPSDVVFGETGILPPDEWGQPTSTCPLEIAHLLNHEYRIFEEQDADWNRVVYEVPEELNLREMVAYVNDEYTVGIPGGARGTGRCDLPDDEYYNYGYGVLAAVVDTVVGTTGYSGGEDFQSFVKGQLLAPAGVRGMDVVTRKHGNVESEGYHHSKDGDPYADWLTRDRAWGWAGWAGTPLEVAQVGQHIVAGAPSSDAPIERYTDLADYGWEQFEDGAYVGHDGAQVGVLASLRADPYRTFCVLCNTNHVDSWGEAEPEDELVERTRVLAERLI